MKKKVLIIDDSALMRRVISDIINLDDRFQVTETAVNGLEGLKILQDRAKNFDAVLLDINMPKMNGLELLAKLKEQNIKATVIVVSTIAVKDAAETIKALELGAFDFVKKPDSYMEVKTNLFSNSILDCLLLAVKADGKLGKDIILNNLQQIQQIRQMKQVPLQVKATGKVHIKTDKLVAIACSTGGPKALHAVIPKLPGNLDAGVLIVQHMPGGFTKSLADRLNELSELTVKEAEDGDIVTKGTVYIAKGGYQMRIKELEDGRLCIAISAEPARHGLLPCADIMYESLSEIEIGEITCIVLTGMGGDGTAGISRLNSKQNTYVIAQDEETSIVYGMPKVIKDAGLVNEVAALEKVSEAITRNVGVR